MRGVGPVGVEGLLAEDRLVAVADVDAVAADVGDRAADDGVVAAAGAQGDAAGVGVCDRAPLDAAIGREGELDGGGLAEGGAFGQRAVVAGLDAAIAEGGDVPAGVFKGQTEEADIADGF